MNEQRVEIPGSAPEHGGAVTMSAALDAGERLTATLVLRRRPGSDSLSEQVLSGHLERASREQTEQSISADPVDLAAVVAFAEQYGLQVNEADAVKRSVKVSGSTQELNRAFGIELGSFGSYTSYNGPITVPASLSGVVIAVLGLDQKSVARPRSASI